ncbi:serine hydrolase [Tychonema sp. LEGE 07199]|uniref:serine hydrolase n=1 Tax=unclassified Tychonema TaxID=2642144 RepID=UPI0018820D73|nr:MULTISPECIES: serine hydrolase [unclassified Tychonema]MBE9124276.1 serine hydrolase [Tychonema sp. LEGE 07199]MBE9134367.1 serine hydrolase [Tychonema sp. LEGE 07196]
MIKIAVSQLKFNRFFYTNLTLICAVLLGGFGKIFESNNNTALAQESIPVSGSGDAQLQPILQSLTEFMRYRCVGAAVLGVSVKGKPVGVWGLGRMKGRSTLNANPACGDDMQTPQSAIVPPDTPMRMGSISKPVTFAMVRWALKQTARDRAGLELTDDQIEGMKLFDPQHYPPLIPGFNKQYPVAIIPEKLHAVFSGKVKFPVAIKDRNCSNLNSGFADKQWQNVTLGHLLSHRSGLQRSAPRYGQDVTANLPVLRNLKTAADFQSQEQLLINEWGNKSVGSAKNQLSIAPNAGYFVPIPTLEEIMLVVAGRCLQYPLGQYHYSNTSPAFPTIIMQQLVASGRYAAKTGKPETHQGSALELFFKTELGIPTAANNGIFMTQEVENFSSREPEKRHWNGKDYYGKGWDLKRPHCIWNGRFCDFSSWINAKPGRINWSWNLSQVLFSRRNTDLSPGTGSLAAEAGVFLKFMSQYWVGGYENNPRIGEKRNNVWNRYTAHNGALDGTHAWAIQLGGKNNPKEWKLPPVDDGGHILDDFANLKMYAGVLPDGVDIFVAVNQRADKKCVEAKGYNCGDAYGLLDNFILYGASRVNWNRVAASAGVK